MSDSIFEVDIIKRVIARNCFEPRNDLIVVYETKLSKTAGGVLLPDKLDLRGAMGHCKLVVVIEVGPGRFIEMTGGREPVGLEPGDLVLVSEQAGLELGQVVRSELGADLTHEAIRIIRSHDILSKLKGRNLLREKNS